MMFYLFPFLGFCRHAAKLAFENYSENSIFVEACCAWVSSVKWLQKWQYDIGMFPV